MTASHHGPIDDDSNGRSKEEADERLDEELEDSFPASDPPAAISPGSGEDPKLGDDAPRKEHPSKNNPPA
ncbi:hypothetical protein [Pseudochelatococcus contaminans]|uniref:Uncharacterized protein n=1 Tax=Pseudochelatococcus contaminans TaxID=1538103 RepID=A0A7W5Z0W0_9HYPH|nr:hypothetical protein [Pseudochelatococcus contaminans]MBB3807968.1 hypothetical protein [Pseudochelatococcus contaminans]